LTVLKALNIHLLFGNFFYELWRVWGLHPLAPPFNRIREIARFTWDFQLLRVGRVGGGLGAAILLLLCHKMKFIFANVCRCACAVYSFDFPAPLKLC